MKKIQFPDDFLKRCYTQDGCIIFTGSPSQEYGRYRGQQAHRYAYQLHHGPIPDGSVIHHTCFCKRCVNPDHLRSVSQRENVRQNMRSGRMAHINKITPSQAIEINRSRATNRELADRYGVSVTTIRRIRQL